MLQVIQKVKWMEQNTAVARIYFWYSLTKTVKNSECLHTVLQQQIMLHINNDHSRVRLKTEKMK